MNKIIRAAVGFLGNKLIEESRSYTFDEIFQSLDISRPIIPDDVSRLNEWLDENKRNSVTMYYSCTVDKPVLSEGILVKSRMNRLNDVTNGYVPLFITQDGATEFAKYNNYYGTQGMYSVDIPIYKLKTDSYRSFSVEYMLYLQEYKIRIESESVGRSLIFGGSAYVKMNIPPNLITKIE